MSEVKRYMACIDGIPVGRQVVLAEDFDALQQSLNDSEKFVQKMADCTKGQDSVATGYISDILDVIKGKKL